MSLINIIDLTFGYTGSVENIFENCNIQLDTDWKLGLVGRNGKGKTTLFNLLLGKLEYRGKILSSAKFEYFPMTIDNKMRLVSEIAEEYIENYEEWRFKKELTGLGLSVDAVWRNFGELSYGEQAKVMIAMLFLRDNTFLLIDEPTNHLDSHGRGILAKYLSTKSGYIIISHDRNFLDNCADHILSINRNSIELQKGNFTDYLADKDKRNASEQEDNYRLKGEITRL